MSNWYYTLNGQQQGPVAAEQIQQFIQAGQLPTDALVWKEGMANWAPVGTVTEIMGGGAPAQAARALGAPILAAAQPAAPAGFAVAAASPSLGGQPAMATAQPAPGGAQPGMGGAVAQNPYQPGVANPYGATAMGGVAPKVGLKQLLFGFQGRIGIGQFWIGTLINFGISFALCIIIMVAALNGSEMVAGIAGLLFLVALIPMTWIALAIQTKRWHDRGKSGWMFLVGFIPLVGGFWVLIECGCLPGTPGPNNYGNPPG